MANETLSIGVSEIPGSINPGQESFYEKMLTIRYPHAKVKKSKYKTVKSLFSNNMIDCVYPLDKTYYKEIYPGSYQEVFSSPVFNTKLRAYTLKSKPRNSIKTLKDLRNKKVMTSEMYVPYLKGIKVTQENSISKRLDLLVAGKIDVLVDLDADIAASFNQMSTLNSSRNLVIKAFPQYILCKSSAKVKKLLK